MFNSDVFYKTIEKIQDSNEIIDDIFIEKVLEDLCLKYEMDHYLLARMHFPISFNPELRIITSQPKEWRERYSLMKYFYHDLTVKHCYKKNTPLIWPKLEDITDKIGKKIFREAKKFNVNYGITIPIHTINCSIGMLTLSSKDPVQLSYLELGELYLIGNMLFEHMLTQSEIEALNIKKLTEKEKECLKEIIEGKKISEISLSLNKSDSCIKFHIKNIIKKLNANDRSHAALIAIRLGLLDY